MVGVLQTIRFQKGLLSIAAPNLKDDTELSTTAVDLICLFKGEPAWVVVSARNPDYIKWQKPRTEEKPAFPPNCSQDPFNSENTCASLSTTQGCSPSTLRVLSKQAEGFSESLSDNLPCQTRRPTPTHDTCLKDRIVGLLDAAQGSSTLHRPSKIVLCFARGLQASFQTLISESFGVVICPLIQPVGFEILLNPAPNQEQTKQSFEFGAQPLASPEADPSKEKLPAKMAPESEALAWSLVEGLPSPSPLARHPSPSGDVSKGADGFSKEWIVLEDPSVDPVQDDLASASRREEETVVSGGLNPNESGVRGQVMDAVRRLENPRGSLKGGRYAEARECTKQGELEALQTAPGLESSFVAIDGPEGSFEGEDSQGQGNMVNEVDPGTKTLAVVENGWVAVRLGVEDVLDRQSSVPNGSKVEEKEWVALSLAAGLQNEAMAGTEVTGGSKEYEQGGQWVGIQQPELTSEDSGAVAGEWIGVARSIGESEQNTNSERTDRNGTWSNGTKGDPISGLEEVSGKDGRRERTGDERDRLERAKAGRNGIFGNGFEANVSSGRTMAEDAPGSAEGRFRTLNQVPLNERPASWPAGLELLNLDTTALVALVSAITNGAAEGLRAMPEQEFRERWKGNAGFMRDQVTDLSFSPPSDFMSSCLVGSLELCHC